MRTDETYLDSPADEFHLACLLLSPTGRAYLGDTFGKVNPEDFYNPVYGWLWGAARVIHSSGRPVTKRTLLAARESDSVPSGRSLTPAVSAVQAALDQISGEPVILRKLPGSIRAVTQTAKIRRLTQALERARSHAVTAEDYSEAVSTTFELLHQLEEDDIPAEVTKFSDLVDQFHKAQAGGLEVGEVVPTPWPELDELFSGGFHPGRSFVVAGRPNAGKSIIGLNCAQVAAEQGFRTLVVSAEMSALEVAERIIAAGARVEYGEITRRSMSPYTQDGVNGYSETNREIPLWVLDKPGLTVEYVAAVARTTKRRQGLDLLVVDYVQLLEATDKRVPREQQVAHISRSMKNLARELGCAVIVLAQLNRDNTKTDRRPTIADLRESDALGQDADAVVLLHHEKTSEGKPTGMVTLIVGKNRFGCQNDVTLPWRAYQARIG